MIQKHATAIGHALNGINWALETQPNYRIHLTVTFLILIGGYFFKISYTEWLIAIVMIIGGFVIETINTSIERLGDAIDKNYNETIKLAKDLSAGAMLFYSIGALIVGCIIFLPKLITILFP